PARDASPCRDQLARGHGPRTERPRPPPSGQPALVIDQAQQAGTDAEQEEGAVAEYRPDPGGPVVEAAEGRIQGLPCAGEDVPEEKQQDPDCEGVEELAEARPGRVQPAHGQPEQDGHAGDEAEEQGLRFTHWFWTPRAPKERDRRFRLA